MIQKDKELLLKDLCARLSYKTYVKTVKGIGYVYAINTSQLVELSVANDSEYWSEVFNIDEIKPYLRPLSSMTEEEKKDILQLLNIHGDIDNEGNLLLGVECNIVTLKVCKKYLGELNKRMFDVCHMIEKGLALEAPEGMYTLNK